MSEFLSSLDWRGLFAVVILWFGVILFGYAMVDRLFPRIRHGDTDSPPFDPAHLYPAPPRPLRARLRAPDVPTVARVLVSPEYWRQNLRLIGALLALWLGIVLLPTLLAPRLNQVQVLTGFPLGYYMDAQGALIVFLAIVAFYAWRAARLDRRFRVTAVDEGVDRRESSSVRRSALILLLFAGGVILFAGLLGGLEARFGLAPHLLGWALLIAVIISFTYLTAQVTGIGIIMNRFLGVNYLLGVVIGLGAVLFCSYLGGMRAITWTQVAQCVVLIIAYLAPVTILSLRSTGIALPQLTYGEALKQIVHLEELEGIANSYRVPAAAVSKRGPNLSTSAETRHKVIHE